MQIWASFCLIEDGTYCHHHHHTYHGMQKLSSSVISPHVEQKAGTPMKCQHFMLLCGGSELS